MHWGEEGGRERGGELYARSTAPISTAKGGRETEERKSIITTNLTQQCSHSSNSREVERGKGEEHC